MQTLFLSGQVHYAKVAKVCYLMQVLKLVVLNNADFEDRLERWHSGPAQSCSKKKPWYDMQ